MKKQPQKTKQQAVQSIEPKKPSIHFKGRKLSEGELNSVAVAGYKEHEDHRKFRIV